MWTEEDQRQVDLFKEFLVIAAGAPPATGIREQFEAEGRMDLYEWAMGGRHKDDAR